MSPPTRIHETATVVSFGECGKSRKQERSLAEDLFPALRKLMTVADRGCA